MEDSVQLYRKDPEINLAQTAVLEKLDARY